MPDAPLPGAYGLAGLASGFLGAYNQNAAAQRQQQAALSAQQALHQMDMDKVQAQEAPRMIPKSLVPYWYKTVTGQDAPQEMLAGVPENGIGAEAMGALAKGYGAPPRSSGGSTWKPDALTTRVMVNAPAYQEMANQYIDAKKQWDATNSSDRSGLVNSVASRVMPLMNTWNANDPNTVAIKNSYNQAQQLGQANQLRYLKALEFVSQSTGAGRTPNPEMVNDIYGQIPDIAESAPQFALKMHHMNSQIGSKYIGIANVADMMGSPTIASKARQQGLNYYKGFHQLPGVSYVNGVPQEAGVNTAPGGGALDLGGGFTATKVQ
jgi:hypothetical protein